MRNHRSESGFTMVELMVVAAIIGILAAIAIPEFTSSMRNSKIAEAEMMLGSFVDGATTYYSADQSCSTASGAEPWHGVSSSGYCSKPGRKVDAAEKTLPGGDSCLLKSRGSVPANGLKYDADFEANSNCNGYASEVIAKLGASIKERVLFQYRYDTTSGARGPGSGADKTSGAYAKVSAVHDWDGKGAPNHTSIRKIWVGSDSTPRATPLYTEHELK